MHVAASAHLETDVDGRNALHYFCTSSTDLGLMSGDYVHSSVAVWIGQGPEDSESEDGDTNEGSAGIQEQHSVHDYMRCMRSLVLLEDRWGQAPMDSLCKACGRRYRTGINMHGGNHGTGQQSRQIAGGPEDTTELADRCLDSSAACLGTIASIVGNVQKLRIREGAVRKEECTESLGGVNLQCSCGGIVWSCAVEQSLKVCALIAPDALRASRRPGGVLGVPICAHLGSNGGAMLADLPKEVRVLICQRSCIATGLMQ